MLPGFLLLFWSCQVLCVLTSDASCVSGRARWSVSPSCSQWVRSVSTRPTSWATVRPVWPPSTAAVTASTSCSRYQVLQRQWVSHFAKRISPSFTYLKAKADPDIKNNEGKKLSSLARDPDVLVVLKKWGIISGLSAFNEREITISIKIFFTGIENGFNAEEYLQNNDSEED